MVWALLLTNFIVRCHPKQRESLKGGDSAAFLGPEAPTSTEAVGAPVAAPKPPMEAKAPVEPQPRMASTVFVRVPSAVRVAVLRYFERLQPTAKGANWGCHQCTTFLFDGLPFFEGLRLPPLGGHLVTRSASAANKYTKDKATFDPSSGPFCRTQRRGHSPGEGGGFDGKQN